MEVVIVPLVGAVCGGEYVILPCLVAVQDFRVSIQSGEHGVIDVRGKVLAFALVAPGLQGLVLGFRESQERTLLRTVNPFYVLRGEESSHIKIRFA